MSDFERVSDDLRALPIGHSMGRPRLPTTDALLNGETIFVPLNGRKYRNVQSSLRGTLHHLGYTLRVRSYTKANVPGIVAWAEKKAER